MYALASTEPYSLPTNPQMFAIVLIGDLRSARMEASLAGLAPVLRCNLHCLHDLHVQADVEILLNDDSTIRVDSGMGRTDSPRENIRNEYRPGRATEIDYPGSSRRFAGLFCGMTPANT